MILFIYGPTQAGKTLLARRLARKTGALALSLDLLKMGLIRSGMLPCTPLEDERIEQLMWPPCASSCKRRSKTTKTSSSKATICRPSGATHFGSRTPPRVVAPNGRATMCFSSTRITKQRWKRGSSPRASGFPAALVSDSSDSENAKGRGFVRGLSFGVNAYAQRFEKRCTSTPWRIVRVESVDSITSKSSAKGTTTPPAASSPKTVRVEP